jgi:Domain of unknown function (DU1801)
MPAKSQPTVSAFLAQLPAERRREVDRLRALIREHLPAGYEEVIAMNMLVYQVPLARYPDTYNKHPLMYVALASQKSYLSLHLMSIYGDATQAKQLEARFRAAGKKLDKGKACIRFKTTDDLELDAIADVVASMPMDRWIEIAQAARRR